MTNDDLVRNNCLCPICGGDHNVLVIPLETGNHVIPKPFFYERAANAGSDIRSNTTKAKRIVTKRIDLTNIFWTNTKEGFQIKWSKQKKIGVTIKKSI